MRIVVSFVGVAIVVTLGLPQMVAHYLPPLLPDQENISHLPEISISIPANIRSETVQGQYFLSGPFGGAGGYLAAKPDVTSYKIDAGIRRTAAKEVKIVLYANGCRTQKFYLLVKKSTEDLVFDCEPLSSATLRGMVAHFDAFHDKDVRIEFDYMASWACEFFGLMDCLVPTFKVATVAPQSDGSFSAVLPDFTEDRNERASGSLYKGQFNLILRENRTGNVLAFLQPRESPPANYLQVQSTYPTVVQFERKP